MSFTFNRASQKAVLSHPAVQQTFQRGMAAHPIPSNLNPIPAITKGLALGLFFGGCWKYWQWNNRAEYTIQKQKDDILYAALIMKRKERMELEERVKELKAEKGAEDSDVDVTVLKNHNVFNPSD